VRRRVVSSPHTSPDLWRGPERSRPRLSSGVPARGHRSELPILSGCAGDTRRDYEWLIPRVRRGSWRKSRRRVTRSTDLARLSSMNIDKTGSMGMIGSPASGG
jgi:hypothetical protein